MKKEPITPDQSRDTGLAMLLILLLIGYLGGKPSMWLPSIIVLVITMTWPKLFMPLAKLWFGFSHLLSSVANRIILTAAFVLVVVPIAFIRRLTGADAMRCNEWGKSADTAFIERDHTYTKEDLNNPY
jgi:hypothetical protein